MKSLIIIFFIALFATPGSLKTGTASYYAQKFEGRRTASGEIFRQDSLTGASNNFPLLAMVKVTNLENGDTIVVKINDRMAPHMAAKGRIIDLSRAGADSLGYLKKGLLKVSVEII